jgi:tetratricopeptide (TPR) repeat protein/TolB-like protein
MTPERWARVVELFDGLVDRSPADRLAVLADAADDSAVRAEVARLLDSDGAAGAFGDSPAFRFTRLGAESAAPALAGGSRLGRYRIDEMLAAGGMGEVYRAHDPELGRDVGVKVLAGRGEITIDQLARFDREARAAAALNHRNILTVYDVGVDRDIPYVVFELLDGETLGARLRRGPLPLADAVGVAQQMLAGMAAAHGKGIVHRDLKPDNLFVTIDGVVKILDFGLAKPASGSQAAAWRIAAASPGGTAPAGTRCGSIDSTAAPPSGVTRHSLIAGTAGYMAPEQIRGEPSDVRADLFSFGAVLYEMITGVRAFAGSSAAETMDAVLGDEPAGLEALPTSIRHVVRRCLQKDAAARYDSAVAVAAALTSAVSTGRRESPKKRRWHLAAAVLLAAAGVATALLLAIDPAGPMRPGSSGRPALAVIPFDDRTGDPAAAWLSIGVPGMIVTALAQTPGVDVIGTERLEASFRELGRTPSDRAAYGDVARHAGAGAVLVGSLFKIDAGFRLEVQVQDVGSGRVVAAGAAQGPDVFAMVDDLTRQVRAALDVASRPAGRPLRDVTTGSLEAYELYTKGQRARHNNRWSDARTLLEEALRIDPSFTLARAQLVTLLERLGENGRAAQERRIIRGELNRLPERQRLLAEAIQEYDNNPALAVKLLEQLLERYPDEEEAYDAIVHAYTHTRDPLYWKKTLAFMQRWARAVQGPRSGHFHNHYGYAYIEHGLFIEAEREFRAYIRVSPDEANGYDSLAELFLLTGRPLPALEQYGHALRLNPSFGWSLFGRAYALAALGRYDEAFAAVRTLQDLGPRAGVPEATVEMLDALLSHRIGRSREARLRLAAALDIARALEDTGAQADASLFAAVFAVERGEYGEAVQAADRAAAVAVRAGVDIMRVRRSSLAHFIAGIAEARAGQVRAARTRLPAGRLSEERRRGLPKNELQEDPLQLSWQRALEGEIALVEGRLDDAEAAFRSSQYRVASSFAIYPAAVALINNLPTRDGLARTAAARGDLATAVDRYRRLNRPDITSTWIALFDPLYSRTAADLAAAAGDAEAARRERARYAGLWQGRQ